jgi:hypothetical protein
MKPERINMLLEKFGPRIDVVEFTEEGLLHKEEICLITDLWNALRAEEQVDITEKLRRERAIELDTPFEFVPDQTPYAMRILFYYLKMRRGELIS